MSSENSIDENHPLKTDDPALKNTSSEETSQNNPPENNWPTDVNELHELLNNLDSERQLIAQKLDKVMRAFADAENKSKRAEKEKNDAIKYGPFKFARDMLEVADNFERALKNFPQTDNKEITEALEGVKLTEKSLHQVLSRFNVKKIATENVAFDPNQHEAVTQIPQEGKNSGDIIDVIRSGYHMGERLLRPAQVVIVA